MTIGIPPILPNTSAAVRLPPLLRIISTESKESASLARYATPYILLSSISASKRALLLTFSKVPDNSYSHVIK